MLWSRELAERTRARDVAINNVEPGLCWTQLHRHDPSTALSLFECVLARPAIQSGYAFVNAAVGQLADSDGAYKSEEETSKVGDFTRTPSLPSLRKRGLIDLF